MAYVNSGFDIASGITEGAWSDLAPYHGVRIPIVGSFGSNKVQAGATAMTVDVTGGPSYAHGVRVNLTTVENVTISSVAISGATRWDAIVIRRDWSNNSAVVMKVEGSPALGAPMVPPSGLNDSPGVLHDQVLALVKATNGSSALVIDDRRTWASKVYTAASLAALPAASSALYGSEAVLATGERFRCLVVAGSPAWVSPNDPTVSTITELNGTALFSAGSGWTLSQTDTAGSPLHFSRGLYDASTGGVQINLAMRRTGAALTGSAAGNVTDTLLGTFPAVMRPDIDTPVFIQFAAGAGSASSWLGGSAYFTKDGKLTLLSLASNQSLNTNNLLRMSINFTKAL